MKVLMLGWEFPPFISGGLGTACYGLTKALNQLDVEITFILPRPIPSEYSEHVRLASPTTRVSRYGLEAYKLAEFSHVTFRALPAMLSPYQSSEGYEAMLTRLRELSEVGGGPGRPVGIWRCCRVGSSTGWTFTRRCIVTPGWRR